MSGRVQGFRARGKAEAEELLSSLVEAERVIVETIERECEALRTGRTLAAKALRVRLRDVAKIYLDASRAARASLWTMEQVLPGCREMLEERRLAFSALLKVEFAVLAAERAAAEQGVFSAADEHMPEACAAGFAAAMPRAPEPPMEAIRTVTVAHVPQRPRLVPRRPMLSRRS